MVVNDVYMSHMVYIWEPSNSGTVVNAVSMIHSVYSGEISSISTNRSRMCSLIVIILKDFKRLVCSWLNMPHITSHHQHVFKDVALDNVLKYSLHYFLFKNKLEIKIFPGANVKTIRPSLTDECTLFACCPQELAGNCIALFTVTVKWECSWKSAAKFVRMGQVTDWKDPTFLFRCLVVDCKQVETMFIRTVLIMLAAAV